ncbi:MAG: APC family permease [Acidimicrobiia bacterium]|nr:APC family permease [Acidimicrobiia bacterium]
MKRELGIFSVIAISLGAMIGSGIFVLPGLAAKIAGPAAPLAYFVAGLIVVPAAFAKSEMATAMPEAGGTYVFVDKGMGPLMGTVAGFGVWFSLLFKSAFALIGLGAYLVVFADVPVKAIAIGLAVGLVVLNAVGVKHTAGVQRAVVFGVLMMLLVLIALGSSKIDSTAFDGFFDEGASGLFLATGVIFVSYAGVTKVASVAEEVRNPNRNIPLSILGSLGLMMVVYPAVVFVMIGVVGDSLADSSTPVVDTARPFTNEVGVDVVAVVAVLALVSMANAGLLASSRYPFAMSRNALAPPIFQRLSQRSGTPVAAVVVTGAAMVLLVAFVPLLQIAKLASAFQLLVFALENLAVLAFRESKVDWYQPTFRVPFYPGLPIIGIIACVALLTQLGTLPLLGAAGITAVGVGWYQLFGRSRVTKQSASLDALRIRATEDLVSTTRQSLQSPGSANLLVVMRQGIAEDRERAVLKLGLQFVARNGRVGVVHLDGPGQAPGSHDHPLDEVADATVATDELDVDEQRTRIRRTALLDAVEKQDPDLLLIEIPLLNRRTRPYINDVRWLREHADRTVLFFHYRGLDDVKTIAIMGSGGPADVAKITLAHRIAEKSGASLRLGHMLSEAASETEGKSIRTYHARLEEVTETRIESRVARAATLFAVLDELTTGADLVILGAASRTSTRFSDLSERIAASLDLPVLTVRPAVPHKPSLRRRLLERMIY